MRAISGAGSRLAVQVPFVDLAFQTEAVREAVVEDWGHVLDSGSFVNGPAVAAFEHAFAESCGREFCVGTASGLDALRLGLIAAGLEPGEEVVVPAMTFIATFEAVAQAGGVPVPVDVREDDVSVDVDAVGAVLTHRTRFVMPVHLYGQVGDHIRLSELCERKGLSVIEDACQAHGAIRDGLLAGAIGRAAGFSFYASKNLGAFGDAGALVTDDGELAARARALREHGQVGRYESQEPGYTARLDTVQAIVLLHKLGHLTAWNAARRRLAALYGEALAGVGDLRLPVEVPGSTHVWHLYAVRTAEPERLAEFLSARGIGTGRHYPQPPHLSPAFAELGCPAGSFPVAEAIARETVSLPLFPGMTDDQCDAVISAVRSYFERG